MQFKRIYIKNFQSIKELEIVLDENTCYHIKGNNNIGKSAFLKAVEALVRNVSSRKISDYIRDNEDSFYIESTDFDNNVVRLSRGKEDYYSWDINGESGRVDSTNGKVPNEVRDYFNFYEELEKSKEIINIRPPRSKLLFVDTTYAENYYLLQKALRIEEYLAAIKLGGKEKNEKKNKLASVKERIEDTENDIDNLPDYTVFLSELEVYEKSIEDYYNDIQQIESILEQNESIKEKEAYIEKTQIPFDRESVAELVNRIKLINDVLEKEKMIQSKEKSILEKQKIIDLHDSSTAIYNQINECINEKTLHENVSKSKSRVQVLSLSIEKKESIIKTYDDSSPKSLIDNITKGNDIVAVGHSLRNKIQHLANLNALEDSKEKERREFMIENKFCPVVMATKDKCCPFSNKSIEELLQ